MLDEGICEPWTKICPAPLSEGAIFSFLLENGKMLSSEMKKNEDTPGCKKKKKLDWERSDSKECKPLIKTAVSSQGLSFPFYFVVKIIEGC